MFPLWPPSVILAVLMMLTIMVILIYGDKICARVRTHTDRLTDRVRTEPMMRMGSSGSGSRHPLAQRSQQPQQHHQQAYHLEEEPQRYSPPPQPHQFQHRYDVPPSMELQKQSTTYGHREIEV